MKTGLALALTIAFITCSAQAGSKHPKRSPSPVPSEQLELDRALNEFQSAANRLGQAMSRAADENTAEARKRMMEISSGVLKQLSDAMNETAKRIQPRPSPGAGR